MPKLNLLYVPALAVSLTLCSAVFSATGSMQSQNPAVVAKTTPISQHDQDFVNKAWKINTTEVRLGDIAQKRAASDAVKDFGKRMVTDHTRLNEELTQLATEHTATLPTMLTRENQDLIDRLDKLSGTEFDKQYITAMIGGHQKAVALFTKESHDKAQTPVDKWAGQTVKVLDQHLELVQKTAKEIGVTFTPEPAAVASQGQKK